MVTVCAVGWCEFSLLTVFPAVFQADNVHDTLKSQNCFVKTCAQTEVTVMSAHNPHLYVKSVTVSLLEPLGCDLR